MAHSRCSRLSRKHPPMNLAAAWNAIIRAVAALLLMIAAATPALAEISCAGESVVHIEALSADDEHEAAGPDQSDQERDKGQPGHCAFSHGHCAGIPANTSRSEQRIEGGGSYARFVPDAMIGGKLAALERPPAA